MVERTTTQLEGAVDAAVAALAAFAYPSDHRMRAIVEGAFQLRGMSWLNAVAAITAALDKEHYNPGNADEARWRVACAAFEAVRQIRQRGAQPREGIGPNGLPANTDEEDA